MVKFSDVQILMRLTDIAQGEQDIPQNPTEGKLSLVFEATRFGRECLVSPRARDTRC